MRPVAVSDILFGGLSDQASPLESFCDGGLQLDAAPGALWRSNGRCNIAGRDRSNGRSKISWHTSGKPFDGEQL